MIKGDMRRVFAAGIGNLDNAKRAIIADIKKHGLLADLGVASGALAIERLDLSAGIIEIKSGEVTFRLDRSGPAFKHFKDSFLHYSMPEEPRADWDCDQGLRALAYARMMRLRNVIEKSVPAMADKLWPMTAEERIKLEIEWDVMTAALNVTPGYKYVRVVRMDRERGEVEILVNDPQTKGMTLSRESFNVGFGRGGHFIFSSHFRQQLEDETETLWFNAASKAREIVVEHCPEFENILWRPALTDGRTLEQLELL